MKVERVAVIGAGVMGSGIAEVAATHGCSVRLIDTAPGQAERARDAIAKNLDRQVQRGNFTDEHRNAALARITTSTELAGLEDVQFVVEAVLEDLEVKQQVFRALDAATAPDAVIATNTSSISVGEIASVLKDPSRVTGMHFFNPAPLMALVEVVAPPSASEAALDTVSEAARDWGKVPARTQDTPGFIVNRVARGFYLEGLRMLDEGVAGIAEIDDTMRALGSFRMGPFQLMDLIGVETNFAVVGIVWEGLGKPARLTPHHIQRSLVERGDHGRKTGRGFYDYNTDPPTAAVEVTPHVIAPSEELAAAVEDFARAAALCDDATFEASTPTQRYIFARILATLMNEAALTLEDGTATAEDIDVAMMRGTNYPKGPLAWAADVGYPRVRRLLEALNAQAGDGRFEPAATFEG
jgi:3-hydroxybutyryl-CoA dehydrogenase